MRKLLTIILINAFLGLFAQQQVELDMQRRLALNPNNSLSNVYYKNLGFSFGLAQRFMLSQPDAAGYINQKINNVEYSLQSLDRSWEIGSNLGREKIQTDYNTLQGFGVSGSFHTYTGQYTGKKLEYANVALSARFNNQENVIGEMPVTNKNLSLLSYGSTSFRIKQNGTFTSSVLTKFSRRDISTVEVPNLSSAQFTENQNLVSVANLYTYSLTTNRKIRIALRNDFYGGDIRLNSTPLKVQQQFNSLSASYNIVRPKFYQTFALSGILSNVNTSDSGYQSWLSLKHDIGYQKNPNKFSTGISNGINLINGKLYYTPIAYLKARSKKLDILTYAGRYMKQITSAYEMYPYVRLENTSPFWLTKDAAGSKLTYTLLDYRVKTSLEASYSRYKTPVTSFFSLNDVLETSLLVDIDFSRNITLDLRYTYTPIKNGQMGELIPEHLGLAHLHMNNIYLSRLNDVTDFLGIYKSVFMNAGLVSGYRSPIGYLDVASIQSGTGSLILDVYIKFTGSYSRDFEFGFEAKNLLNNGIDLSRINNSFYLFSDGLRLMRTFSFTASKTFN
jgi:hypothetical protein